MEYTDDTFKIKKRRWASVAAVTFLGMRLTGPVGNVLEYAALGRPGLHNKRVSAG